MSEPNHFLPEGFQLFREVLSEVIASIDDETTMRSRKKQPSSRQGCSPSIRRHSGWTRRTEDTASSYLIEAVLGCLDSLSEKYAHGFLVDRY